MIKIIKKEKVKIASILFLFIFSNFNQIQAAAKRFEEKILGNDAKDIIEGLSTTIGALSKKIKGQAEDLDTASKEIVKAEANLKKITSIASTLPKDTLIGALYSKVIQKTAGAFAQAGGEIDGGFFEDKALDELSTLGDTADTTKDIEDLKCDD